MRKLHYKLFSACGSRFHALLFDDSTANSAFGRCDLQQV